MSLKGFIQFAYRVNANYQISGGPNWIGNDTYDILAGTAGPASEDEVRLMLQSLLAERFKLMLHRETKEMSALALVIGKNGSKLKRSEGEGNFGISTVISRSGAPAVEARHALMSRFAAFLTTFIATRSEQLTPVMDMTGLAGQFDFTLDLAGWDPATKPEDIAPSRKDVVMAAIQEQLGLKLESRKVPIEILVVDHVEKPSEN